MGPLEESERSLLRARVGVNGTAPCLSQSPDTAQFWRAPPPLLLAAGMEMLLLLRQRMLGTVQESALLSLEHQAGRQAGTFVGVGLSRG